MLSEQAFLFQRELGHCEWHLGPQSMQTASASPRLRTGCYEWEGAGQAMETGSSLACGSPPVQVCQGFLPQPFLACLLTLSHPPWREALSEPIRRPGHPHLNPCSSFGIPWPFQGRAFLSDCFVLTSRILVPRYTA